MGTRHMQMVISKKGETKVNNYGQWDGYPEGQGVSILEFLRKADLNKYDEKVQALREATQEDFDSVNAFVKTVSSKKLDYKEEREVLRANKAYYALSRDCGSNIHQMILDGDTDCVLLDEDGHDHAAYVYVINLQERTFSIKGYCVDSVYSLDDLPTDEKFIKDNTEEEE